MKAIRILKECTEEEQTAVKAEQDAENMSEVDLENL
jgi:hypothetical protein